MLLLRIIEMLFTIFNAMILVRILSSWVPELYQYKAIQFVAFCVDPYLNMFKKIIPPMGMIDISPIIAIISLNVFEGFLFYLIQ